MVNSFNGSWYLRNLFKLSFQDAGWWSDSMRWQVDRLLLEKNTFLTKLQTPQVWMNHWQCLVTSAGQYIRLLWFQVMTRGDFHVCCVEVFEVFRNENMEYIYKLVFSIVFQPASLDCRTSPSLNLFYAIRASRYSRPPLLATVEPSVDSISPRMDPTNQVPEMNLEEVGTILRNLGFSAGDDPLLSTLIMLWFQLGVMKYHGMSLYVSMLPFEEDECLDHMIKLIWDDQVTTHTQHGVFSWKKDPIGLYFNGKVKVWFLV